MRLSVGAVAEMEAHLQLDESSTLPAEKKNVCILVDTTGAAWVGIGMLQKTPWQLVCAVFS